MAEDVPVADAEPEVGDAEPDAEDAGSDPEPDGNADATDVGDDSSDADAATDLGEPDVESDAETDSDVGPAYDGPIMPIGVDLCLMGVHDASGLGLEQPIRVFNETGATFEIAALTAPAGAAPTYSFDLSELPITVPDGENRAFHFLYEPGYPDSPESIDYEILLQQGEHERSVTCRISKGSLPDFCETVDISLSVIGDPLGRSGPGLGWARPLDRILIEAIADEPGAVLADISWRIDNAPFAASFELSPSEEFPGSASHREYSVFTTGPYTICADAVSADDEICTQCAELNSSTGDGLWVELDWPFPTGNADLQMHAVPADSLWFDEDSDSWPENTSAEWIGEDGGYLGGASPTGPWFMRLLGECRWYALGVFHNGGDSASPAVSLFLDGEPLDQLGGPELQAGEFWDVARIHLPSMTIDFTDNHLREFVPHVDAPPRSPLMARVDLCTEEEGEGEGEDGT